MLKIQVFLQGLVKNDVNETFSIFLSLTNLHLPDFGFLFSLLIVLVWAKKFLMLGFLVKLGSSSGSISSNSILTHFSSIRVSAVFQLNLTMDGNPKTGSKLSRRNFLVTASPGYPDPHSDVISQSPWFSGKIQVFKHLSRATWKNRKTKGCSIIFHENIIWIFLFDFDKPWHK